ncbi:helix-turn-helix transcriptional regulator [Flavobacterium sp. 5]|uniref:helix-turn-helix transcriptional regulator n=1 Tax=Flavobacterium sp. 5 TaxID=2035199 RepID=UPI000C2B66BB|nr:helix-turn-helix transcriptional regulator [Flavobacterium sp. 5]PKB18252.1 AraC family transcriptional regulator [Flavobacterium sp. 5]
MKVTDYKPKVILRPYIKTFRLIESGNEIINRVLPMTSLAISFRINGQISYISDNNCESLPSSTISGLRKSVRLINYSENTSAIIILFTETGISAFSKMPAHELFEKTVSLDNFFNQKEIHQIESLLFENQGIEQKISIIENFLLSKLEVKGRDDLITAAIDKINSTKGSLKITELAKSLYISNDAFEKRFRKTVGTTPKKYSTIVKLSSLAKQGDINLLERVFETGYYDQPHFNKDFKLFTGQSPTDFYKINSFW